MNDTQLPKIATYIRHCILTATNQADSGHPTSSLSATDLMTALLFGGIFRYDPEHPQAPNNDRLIFSKGHASPLFYALWVAAGQLAEERMLTYRQFGSPLEGHPTMTFPFTEAATGSLGQGLAVGVGMALNAKYLDKLPYRTYVLLGDSEMAEGSQWESLQIAAHYGLDNLIGILDVNGLGQRGETMYGQALDAYVQRVSAFGWATVTVDGHSPADIVTAYRHALQETGRPVMIVAKTVKGKGVPSVEGQNGYHGKALGEDAYDEAAAQWDRLDKSVRGTIARPGAEAPEKQPAGKAGQITYEQGDNAATRDAYGTALNRICNRFPPLVVLDGEVSNSTRAATFRDEHPDRFFEMYIAEQNMVGTALGLCQRGKKPFVSSFAAFLTRAFDQIRMAAYSDANIVFAGSHAGTSIGKDGPSQMGLEDLAMFRSVFGSVVLYPSDAVSTEVLTETAAEQTGIVYIRLTRGKTPVLYGKTEAFPIGGSKTVRSSDNDRVTVVSAGYILHESLKAAETLAREGVAVRVIDVYSIKPLDEQTLIQAAQETQGVLVAEDHYPEGGIGEAVFNALHGRKTRFEHVAVTRKPRSGPTDDVLADQGLSADRIAERIRQML